MLSVKEKIQKLKDMLAIGDTKQFNQLMGNPKFIDDLPKRSPEVFFLMYQSAVHPDTVNADMDKANRLLEAAVSVKYLPAVAEKGRIKFDNAKCTADYFEAEDYFRAAAKVSFMARYYIAKIYHYGLIEVNGERKFDTQEAKTQLKILVSAREEYYTESVLLLAEVILKMQSTSKNDAVFFDDHINPLVEKGNIEACKSLGKFNIYRFKSVIGMMDYQNDKDLSSEYFEKKLSLAKISAHLEKIELLMIKC